MWYLWTSSGILRAAAESLRRPLLSREEGSAEAPAVHRRWVQCLMFVSVAFSYMPTAYLAIMSFDLAWAVRGCVDMGLGEESVKVTALSSLFSSTWGMGNVVGCLLGVVLTGRTYAARRRWANAMCFLVCMVYSILGLCCLYMWVDGTELQVLLLASLFAVGVAGKLPTVLVQQVGRNPNVTPASEQLPLSMAEFVGAMLGQTLGAGLASMVGDLRAPHEAECGDYSREAVVFGTASCLGLLQALFSLFAFPHAEPQGRVEKEGPLEEGSVVRGGVVARWVLPLACVCYLTLECVSGALETSTPYILETVDHLREATVGEYMMPFFLAPVVPCLLTAVISHYGILTDTALIAFHGMGSLAGAMSFGVAQTALMVEIVSVASYMFIVNLTACAEGQVYAIEQDQASSDTLVVLLNLGEVVSRTPSSLARVIIASFGMPAWVLALVGVVALSSNVTCAVSWNSIRYS